MRNLRLSIVLTAAIAVAMFALNANTASADHEDQGDINTTTNIVNNVLYMQTQIDPDGIPNNTSTMFILTCTDGALMLSFELVPVVMRTDVDYVAMARYDETCKSWETSNEPLYEKAGNSITYLDEDGTTTIYGNGAMTIELGYQRFDEHEGIALFDQPGSATTIYHGRSTVGKIEKSQRGKYIAR